MDLEILRSPLGCGLCWTRIPSPLPPSLEKDALTLLSREEEERYARFSHRPAAEMYLGARLFSKTLLSDLISRPPDSIRFSYREGGKPYLKDHPELFFNISHSAGAVALLHSDKGETGVDVEEIRDRDCLNLARHFFSDPEISELEGISPAERMVELFFQIWTQKEAYLKGTGKGLPGGLKHYTVPCISGEKRLGGFLIDNFRPYPDIMGAYALPS